MKKTLADYRLLNAGLSAFKRLAEKAGFRKTKPQEQKPQEQKPQEQPIKQLTKEEIAQIEKERELAKAANVELFYLLMQKLVIAYETGAVEVKPLDIGGWFNCVGFRVIIDPRDGYAAYNVFREKAHPDNYFVEVPVPKDGFQSVGNWPGSFSIDESKEQVLFIKGLYDLIDSGGGLRNSAIRCLMAKEINKDLFQYAKGLYSLKLKNKTLPYLDDFQLDQKNKKLKVIGIHYQSTSKILHCISADQKIHDIKIEHTDDDNNIARYVERGDEILVSSKDVFLSNLTMENMANRYVNGR